MKKIHIMWLAGLLVLVLGVIGAGFSIRNFSTTPQEAIEAEFHALKNLDKDMIEAYLPLEAVSKEAGLSEDSAELLADIYLCFFRYFDYDIGNIVLSDNQAVVHVDITSLSVDALIRDYYFILLDHQMDQSLAGSPYISAEESFAFFLTLLEEHTYDTVQNAVQVQLIKEGKLWKVQKSSELQDALTGSFLAYTAAEDLITPSETLEFILQKVREMDSSALLTYLNLNDIFSLQSNRASELDGALLDQITNYLDFHIKSCDQDGDAAWITVDVVSLSMEHILQNYAGKLLAYGSTSASITATAEEEETYMTDFLKQAITDSTEITINTIEIHMTPEGLGWSPRLDSAFTDAILGGFTQAMQTFNTTTGPSATDDSDTDDSDTDDSDTDDSYTDNSNNDNTYEDISDSDE